MFGRAGGSMENRQKTSHNTQYHLEAHEKPSDGVRRMALEQIDKALDLLASPGHQIDDAIHDARVCFKKVRALLRLVKPEIGVRRFKQENMRFREAGRRLSEVRDSAVVIEAFDKLTQSTDALSGEDLREMRASLVRAEATPIVQKKQAMSQVAACIASARESVADWPIEHKGFAALGPGLREVYRKGRAMLERARDDPTTENLHELRKRVKDLGYQTRVLRPAWPGMLQEISGEIKELGDNLSEHHDLSVLREAVLGVPGLQTKTEQTEEILALINRRQWELRFRAMPQGERVYVEKPGAFTRRIRGYWETWHQSLDEGGMKRPSRVAPVSKDAYQNPST